MLVYQDDNSIKTHYFYYRIFQGTSMPSHFHKCYEMMYAPEGNTIIQLDGETICLKEGEMCLLVPNCIHSFEVHPAARLWVCVFSEDLVETFYRETENRRYVNPVFQPSEALVHFLPMEQGAEFESMYLLQAFLYRLCHEFHQQNFQFVTEPDTDSDSVHRIMSYISHHYNQDISLSMLARKFGLNKNYISTIIGKTTQQNFRTYLNGYRLEKAKELLRNTDMPITDIAYECGYNNIRTFNRAFSGREQITPVKYRRGR